MEALYPDVIATNSLIPIGLHVRGDDPLRHEMGMCFMDYHRKYGNETTGCGVKENNMSCELLIVCSRATFTKVDNWDIIHMYTKQ